MRTPILLMAILLTSCGPDKYPGKDYFLAPVGPKEEAPKLELNSFEGYVDLFLEDAAIRGVDLQVNSLIIYETEIPQDDEAYVLGECYLEKGAVPRIQIDAVAWRDMDPTSKQLLLYHELGHCLLHRDHTTDPKTIMFPVLIPPYSFLKNHKAMLDELFDSSKFNSWKY